MSEGSPRPSPRAARRGGGRKAAGGEEEKNSERKNEGGGGEESKDHDDHHEDGGATKEEKPRRRRRDLLKMYYGATETEELPTNPMDLDSPAFNAVAFLDKLYGECDLHQLMTKEDELARQVKSLDSDMQTLVYENYNKFITASETIRKMKSQVDNMEEEMQRLEKNMHGISTLSKSINSTLDDRRDRMRQLSTSHSILKKMQFLFELPNRLKQCLDMKSYDQAVLNYHKAKGVLFRYKDMDSFRGIYTDCIKIVSKLKVHFNAKLDSGSLSQRELVDTLGNLLKLDEDPGKICDVLLMHAKQSVGRDCARQDEHEKQAKAFFGSPEFAAQNTNEDTFVPSDTISQSISVDTLDPNKLVFTNAHAAHPLCKFVMFGNDVVLFNMAEWVISVHELFLKPTPLEEQGYEDKIPESVKQTRFVAQAKMAQFFGELFQSYFKAVTSRIAVHVKEGVPIMSFILALEELSKGMQKFHELLPILELHERSLTLITEYVTYYCQYTSYSLKNSFKAKVEAVCQTLDPVISVASADHLKKGAQELMNAINEDFFRVVTDLQNVRKAIFALQHFYFKETFPLKSVRRGIIHDFISFLHDFLLSFIDETISNPKKAFVAIAVPPPPVGKMTALSRSMATHPTLPGPSAPPPQDGSMSLASTTAALLAIPTVKATCTGQSLDESSLSLLLLAQFSGSVETHCIQQILSLGENFFGLEVGGYRHVEARETDQLAAKEFSRANAQALKMLLTQYLTNVGNSVARRLGDCYRGVNWLDASPPSAPRPEVQNLIQELCNLGVMLFNLLPEPKDGKKYRPPRPAPVVLANTQKLFTEKVIVYQVVESNRFAAMTALVKMALKALSEELRTLRLTPNGFHQVEVEVYSLHVKLCPYLAEELEGDILTLLDHVVLSAFSRCAPAPSQLDRQRLDALSGALDIY